jgi:transcriptional regulator with XRE-family HTH domain
MYNLKIIKKLRQGRGLTQAQLAELTGLDRSYISRIETENISRDRSPTLLVIKKLSIALNVCPTDLIWYSCDDCSISENCSKKNEIDLENLMEKTLEYYR